jgi:hypothetical protein
VSLALVVLNTGVLSVASVGGIVAYHEDDKNTESEDKGGGGRVPNTSDGLEDSDSAVGADSSMEEDKEEGNDASLLPYVGVAWAANLASFL